MKILKTLIPALIFASGIHSAAAQGISFAHGSWSTVLQKAKNSGKFIFVDFYATWCGPCIQMSREVFTDPEVGDYFNKHFISYKVDAEREEQTLVNSIEIEAYPTLVFFDQNGKIVYKYVGALETDELLFLGGRVASFKTNRQKALNGTASMEETLEYLSIAVTADPENYKRIAQKLVNEFTAEDLEDYDAWDVLVDQVSDANHPAFQHAIEAAVDLYLIYEEDYLNYVNTVLNNLFNAVVKSGNLKELDIYKKHYQILYRDLIKQEYDYRYFDLNVNSSYYRTRRELDKYGQTMTEWVESYALDDWETLTKSALEMSTVTEAKQHQEQALQWALRAVSLDRNKHTLYNLAKVYANNDRRKDAIKCAKEVLELELVEEEYTLVENFIRNLEY